MRDSSSRHRSAADCAVVGTVGSGPVTAMPVPRYASSTLVCSSGAALVRSGSSRAGPLASAVTEFRPNSLTFSTRGSQYQ